jgi:hypothetical protein
MSLKCKFKWREIRHREVYEPDGIYDLKGDGETEFLNGSNDRGYMTRLEAISDLQRINDKYPHAIMDQYVLMEFWYVG